MDYRSIIESKYNRESWLALLHDIFRKGASFMANPILVDSHSDLVSSSLQLGTITLNDGNKIAIYEVRLSERVDIVANRVGIRNLLVSDWKLKGCVGAFMFCFKEDESVLRFSYVSETWTFSDDGKMQKESTDTKRFTYLLGAGHRSRTAIGQFEKLRDSALTLKDLTKAFSLEALSDRFFEGYKGIYEDIIEAVTGKRMMKISNKWEEKVTGTGDGVILREFSVFDEPEKAIRDYVKNLMGRIVFLQFLQKKGWLGVPIDKAWGSGDKEFIQNLYSNCPNKSAFIDDILEVLFDDINSKREDDIASSVLGKDIKVPYLNGGLFEKSLADTLPFKLKPEILDNMFKFFGEYNFTIDENDPDDAEIGVDPEMLGRIFENLLEDNKDKGAFYTPKEIVQYMCKESLIAYLQTGVNDKDKEAIRSFVMTYDIRNLSVPLQQVVDKKLKDVKICDPAIGSGAFPMGLLKELFECRSAIEGLTEDNASEIKKHIIQNNIYGVDIEKGAVDIARLRFWLALIVDEKTPHALPNMDFKIMQGNSLLESYEGIDLSELMDNSDDEDEDEPVRNLWGEIEDGQLHLTFKKKGSAKKLRGYIDEYYSVEDHTRKKELFNTIESIIREQIAYNADLHISQAETQVRIAEERIANRLVPKQKDQKDLEAARQELAKYERIREEAATLSIINNQFFLWHTWFSDVFNRPSDCDKSGFDIVIGNPPYGASIKGEYRKAAVDALGKVPDYEIYYFFIEVTKILRRSEGVVCYIVPNTWLFNVFASDYRRQLCNEWDIIELLDCTGFKIFNATVLNSIFILQESLAPHDSLGYRPTSNCRSFKELIMRPRQLMKKTVLLENNQNWGLAFKLAAETQRIIGKIASCEYSVASYFKEISQGLIAYDKYQGQAKEVIEGRIYHHSTFKPGLKKWLWGEDIKRYCVSWNGKEWIDYCDGIANPRLPKFFKGERLLIREITNPSIFAALTSDEAYNDPAVIIVRPSEVFSIKVLLAILNSEMATFFHFNHSSKASKGAFPKILLADIKAFPLPLVGEKDKASLEKLVEKRMAQPNSDNNNDIEKAINNLVYALYGINDKQVRYIRASLGLCDDV